jgi:hypothetical protein
MKPYYHELSDISDIWQRMTRRQVLDTYAQPDWCDYPEALDGYEFGCEALVSRRCGNVSREFCKDCDAFKDVDKGVEKS